MNSLAVTPIYAAICGIILVAFSLRVIRFRQRHRVDLGDGGHPQLQRAIRVHGNFVEYVPLSLILICLLELTGAPPLMLHLLGAGLLVSRLGHAWGLMSRVGTSVGRAVGMVGTFMVILVASVTLLSRVLPGGV